MGGIDIDPAEVRRCARQLKECANELSDKLGTFNNIESEVSEAWKSRYTSQYLNCLETTEGNLRRTRNSINAVADNLNRIAGSVDAAEAEIQRQISGSGGGFSGGGSGGGGGGTCGGR